MANGFDGLKYKGILPEENKNPANPSNNALQTFEPNKPLGANINQTGLQQRESNANIAGLKVTGSYMRSTPSYTPRYPMVDSDGYPTTASFFQQARRSYDSGNGAQANALLKSYVDAMQTAGSKYYQPYYTSFVPDQKYESDTLEVEQALRDMYQDVRVAVAKGYSDAWIASNITSSKYKALKAADEAVTNGNPKKYTRQIPYLGADTVYGMIYQARNGDEYNSDIFSDVARYYMGYGKQYAPDDTEQAIRDRTSDKWNPYAFGGASASPTMNSLCGKYGVMGFTREWAQKHANELESNGDREKVFKIIEDTEKAEAEYKRLQETIAQRLRDGESVDDVYNLYFGNNMAYLKSGRKGDALDDGEEGYATLFNMEYKRQQQGAYDLAWEVPFSSYGIKDWMAGEVEAMQREKEDADYQTFYDAVPEDYRGAVLSLYARDKGLKKSEFSAEDLPQINAWIEEKGLAQQTDENAQGPVQSYGDRLYSFAQAQRAERAETVEPTPNFTASEFLTQVNEQDKDGNKTMDAANANADFQLGLQDYYAGLPVDDPNVKAFVQKYAFLMGDTGRTVTDSGDAGSLISFDNTTSFENNRGSVLKGGRESTWLTEAEKTYGVDSPEWAQTLLTYANAYDQWVDSGASKSLSFDAFVDQTPELWEQIATVHEDIQAAKAKAQETEAANKVETANKNNAILNRVANGEQLEDYRDSYAWAAIQRQDVRDAKENDAGYKSALDSLTAYGAEFLQGNSATTGTDYWADNFRRNENEFICAEAGKQIDQLMKAAQASGMSFDEYCKAVNIDADTFAQSAYATAYTDYREALDVGIQVAQAVGELSKDELKSIYKTNKMRDKADEWNQEPVLQELLSQGRITQQQYDDFKRLYDDNDTNGGVLTGGDNLLRMAGSQVMGGKDRTLVEGEDRQSVAQELFNTQRNLRLDERTDYQKGVSGTTELVASGDSGNVATVLWNGVHNGTLTFADSWVVSAMGWLGRDRSEIEANARAKYSRDEYRGILENGIREKISNPELYEQYKRQLDNYTGDIYKFDFDNRTLGLQNAHANLNDQMQAIDEEMATVLTPDAYQWYKYTTMAVNSLEMSVPTMIVSAVTHGAAVPTLIAQLASTGVVEGGQTAYELQQAGVSAGASKGAGLMVGGLTALSEWGLDDLVTGMTYKSGIVKAINGVTDINAASRALAIANAVYSKTGSEGLAALAKYSGYALFGTAQGAIKMGVGAVGESLQEVQQEATADFIKTQYGQQMKEVDAYAQVFKDSFYSGLIQSAGTSIVGQVKRNVDTIRANNAITKETFNEMAGEALSVEGALAQRQAYLDEKQRGMEELQNELNALYAEREAGQQILEDAESYARMKQDEANLSVGEALKLHNSDLVKTIEQDQAESAKLGNMLAEFERMIDEDNAMVEMAREPIERGNPTEAELSQFDEAVGIVTDAQQKHDELAQRKAELDAKIAENQKTRKAQQEAIARQARAQAVEAETQRRVQAEQEREAKRNAEIQKLEDDYAQRVAEEASLKDEIKALQKAYGNIALNGAVSGQARVEQTNAEYQAKHDFSPASIKAVQAAQLMFRQFSGEDIKAVARRQALLKENLKHGLELSFPGYDIAFENMGMGEDAKVITEEDGTSRIVLNSEASIPALMSGIVQHEITHIAEAGGRYVDLFQSATQAVYGDQEAVNRAMAAKEAELRAENPGISEDVTEPNNVYSQAQKEIVADAMANILGATNTAATEGQTGVYQIDWSKALSKNNPLLANDIFEWLKIRSKELSKFAKATKDKAVKAQYNNFARVANLLYDCLQDVANKNTRSVEERGAFIGNPADYGIGESEAARTYAERKAPAASATETATATETAPVTETAPQPKADETDEPVRTDEGYTTAPAQPEAQPAQMADETGEPVRTDTGFATVPQRTEQQSEQRANEPVAGITYAQREAPEATTAAVQTAEATTTQPEQTAQESPAEAPTVRGESAEANEYAEREASEESPYVEMLDENEGTEVEQEEQEQESAAPDTPATGEAAASTNPDVAAVSEGENAIAEGEEVNASPAEIVEELKQTVEDAVEQDVSNAITEQPDTNAKLQDMEKLLEGTKERITYWTDRANQAAQKLAEATKAAAKKAAQKSIDFANRRAEAARQRVADLQTKVDALRASLQTETQESVEQTAPETAPVLEQPTTKQKRNAVSEGQVSMFDQLSEYSRGFLARFNNSVLLNALQSQLEAARQSGNSAAYRRLAGRMLGIIRNATFDDTNRLNPVETLKRLADKIGSHIYEKVRMGAGEVSEYQEFARGILTNKAAATSFSALMENVGQAVLESAGATPDASGNVTLNGTSYTQAALNDMFLQWMTTNDAAVTASRLLTQFQDNLQAALQNSEGGQERLEALTTARNDLNTYLSTQRGEQIAYFVRSLDAQQKENNGWLSKIYRTVVGETLDKTVYADIIDKATDYQSNVRREVRYRPYGYGIASQLVDGRAFVDARGNRVAGAETLASWLERAYDNFDDYGGQNAVYQRINQVLMIQSALDRMNRGQNPFTDSYVLAGTDIGRLVNPDKQMLTDALNRIQSIDPNALQAAENVRRWFRDVMQTFGVNENFLSQKTLDDWNKRDPHYAPLLRFMNDTVDGGDELSGALGGSSLSSVIANNKGLQFKKAKGNSDRTVVNPIESMISMANVMAQKAINNQAGRAFAHAFDLTPGLGGMAVEISPEQALAYKGGSGERLLAVQSEVTGQPTRYFLLNNAELYDLLVGTSHTNYNSLFARIARFLGHGTHMMTRLTTGANPLFAFKNMVRDFQHSVNFGSWASNYGSGAVKWVRAFAEVASYKFRSELSDWFRGEDNVRVSQQLEDFITLGGEDYTRYGQGRNLDVGQVRRSLMGEGVARRTGRHLMNIVTCASLNDAVEMASRYAEYRFGQNQTTDKKGATDESKRAAFMASREATTDFAQGGDSTGAYVMRQLIPFLNATLQGKYQELRAFSGAERGRLGARLAKTICNNVIMGTLSYLLCTAFGGGFDDDEPDKAKWVTALEEYDQISDSLKRDYFLLPFSALGAEGARDIIRIPLGHDFVSKVAYEMGRSAVENVMNAYYGKEASVSDWMGDFVMAGLDCIGELGDFTAITTPISSVMNNRSWTGNAIASDSLLSAGWSNAYSNSTWGGFRIGANIVNNLFECMGVTDDRLRMLGTPVGQEYLFQQYTGIVGQLLIPALSKDSYTGEKAMPLQSIERVITNAWTLDAESSTDIPDAFSNCLDRIDSIVQSGNQRKGLGLLSANLTDEQVTMAHEEAKRLLSDNGELGQIKKQINELWGKYNSVMSDTSLSRKEREENAEPYRKEIVNLQEKGLAIGQQYYDKYDIEPSLLRGFVQGLQLNDRVVTPMTNAQRGNYDVSLNYDNVPDSYMQETQRLSEWYDAQPDDYKKQNGKTVSSKIYATPNLSFSYKKTKYDTADYPGSEDDVRTWYGEYYWQTYDKVIAGSKWQNADEEERIAMLSEIDTKANTYAKERFLQTYVAKK